MSSHAYALERKRRRRRRRPRGADWAVLFAWLFGVWTLPSMLAVHEIFWASVAVLIIFGYWFDPPFGCWPGLGTNRGAGRILREWIVGLP